jgi:hypothetical protein
LYIISCFQNVPFKWVNLRHYRVVAAFADPVTVKKVRFVKGPDGRGGGKPFREAFDELFDEETAAWLEAEMLENRRRWKELARRKSWLAATAAGDGTRHGWWEDDVQNDGSKSSKIKNNININGGKSAGEGGNMGVVGEDGHDIRGCASFRRSAACARACRFARKHAPHGKLTRGAVLDAANANAANAMMAPADVADASDDEVFYDAEDVCL